MADFSQFRGVSDIVEDGFGGFTMDSVFYHANGADRYVTSVFKKSEPEPSTEAENWNPTGFNFKAAVGDSPQRKRTEVQGEKIKEVHQSKKSSSGRKKKARDPMVKRHLGEAFSDSCSDILTDVTNEFGKMDDENTFAGKQKQDQKTGERGVKELMKSLKEEHGIDCVYGEHIKGKLGDFETLEIFPVDLSKEKDQDMKEDEQEVGEQRIEDMMKNLKEDHGINCDCEDYAKEVVGHYESLGVVPFDLSKVMDLMEEQEADENAAKEDRMDVYGSEVKDHS